MELKLYLIEIPEDSHLLKNILTLNKLYNGIL